MPKRLSKKEWRKPRKKEYLETIEHRYYIFSEGEKTEPNYFLGFKRAIEDNPVYRNLVHIEIEPCGAETLRVVNQAEEYVRENGIERGQVWCVYDKDSFPAADFNGANFRIEQLNQSNSKVQYRAAWSNECIEFWFLLHFSNYTSNNSREVYKEALNRIFRELGLKGYKKNMEEIFPILLKHGTPRNAIRYAERTINNHEGERPSAIAPGTTVCQLPIP